MTTAASTSLTTYLTESWFRNLFANLGVAVIAADGELSIRFWNSAAARMFGAASDQMIGTPAVSVIPQDRRAFAERALQRVLKTREIAEFEFHERDVHGQRREFIAVAAPILTDSGEPAGVSLCIRDITQRICLQAELAESLKMASLGEMAGAIAHHFNNILGGIITSVDYASAGKDPLTMIRVLDQTARGLIRASALVNGLLAFSQREQRADDLADFTEVITELVDNLEKNFDMSRIRFELKLPVLPMLPVARTHVRTILGSIIQNAIEAMPDGGELKIEITLSDERIETSIRDSGCGLDDEARSRIFEPFWSTKGRFESSRNPIKGLGLAVAYGLIQVLGGSITVASELNKGSCFKISLPRLRSA